MKQEESGSTKRVSFLMPYIDFCFMLIIIFVGMLSIAYFEPLGRTDIQTQRATTITKREGRFDSKPLGVQWESQAPGDMDEIERIHAMQGGETITPLVVPGGAGLNRAAQRAAASGASKEELERLREELRQKEEELKKMIEERPEGGRPSDAEPGGATHPGAPEGGPADPDSIGGGGIGNHHYIDLRKPASEN